MDLDILPVIDWELGAKLVGNKKEVAIEMIHMLSKTLPDELATIQQLHTDQNVSELLKRVHKLHGAVSYCGLPRLKSLLSELECELKNNTLLSVPSLLGQLGIEVKLILEHPAILV